MRKLLLFLACMAISSLAAAITIHVPSEYLTIQAGIVASSDGDTVLVSAGTYIENIDFLGKAITVKSEQGADLTIIDGNQAGSVVTFDSGEDEDSVIEGFTLTNGLGSGGFWDYTGGGITCKNSSDPAITNNSITRNSAQTAGGGIACLDYSDPIITNNSITGNTASQGGGIYGLHSFLTIGNNTITGNTASSYGGGIYGYYVGAIVTDNIISGNTAGNKGGGMAVLEATHTPYPIWEIRNNIIADNSAGNGGGGISIQCSFPDGHHITNNIITGNSAESGGAIAHYLSAYPVITNSILWDNSAPEIYISTGGGNPTINYSDIMGGWPGIGNIDEDPLFVTAPFGNYYLSQTAAGQPQQSPCVDAGDPSSPMIEGTTRTDGLQDEGIVDMGYHYCLPGVPPAISVTLAPYNPPILIPANGGTFDFNLELMNTGNSPAIVDLWTMVTLPDSSEYGPIIDIPNFPLDPGAAVNRDRTQSVPVNAPPGDYTYDAYAGIYPDMILSEDHFDFEKLTVSDGGTEVQNWRCRGEGFEPMDEPDEILNSQFSILNCFPNPFNPSTTISFQLPDAGSVKITVFDVTGRAVGAQNFAPMQQWYPAGTHKVTFNGSDLSSGVYFVRMVLQSAGALQHGNRHYTSVRKMLLLK